jgi:glycosyltransferase involved in cell wall biosynthesis
MLDRSRRLVFLINDAPSFASRRIAVLKAAVEAGFEVHVIAPSSGVPVGKSERAFHDVDPRKAVQQIVATGAVHEELPMTRGGMNPIGEARALLATIQLYRKLRPDVAHHFALKAILYGTLAAWITRVPTVINSFIGLGYVFLGGSLLSRAIRSCYVRLYAFLSKRTSCITVFQNPDDAETIRREARLDPKRMRLIRGSGVDLTQFTQSDEPAGVPAILLASRMLRDKGVIEFCHAAKLLHARGVSAHFLMVGGTDEGNPARLSEREVEQLCVDCGVQWLGQRYDMPAVVSAAHVVCLPSYGEGVPKSLLEASACGRAVIGSDVPGCREAVMDGVNGLLVPVRDARALANAIEQLIASPIERRQLGTNGRRLVQEKFSIDRIVHETLSLYETAAASRAPDATSRKAS